MNGEDFMATLVMVSIFSFGGGMAFAIWLVRRK